MKVAERNRVLLTAAQLRAIRLDLQDIRAAVSVLLRYQSDPTGWLKGRRKQRRDALAKTPGEPDE